MSTDFLPPSIYIQNITLKKLYIITQVQQFGKDALRVDHGEK
ncbi:11585_t:CDS:1, partial [Acaulospora colombiana]